MYAMQNNLFLLIGTQDAEMLTSGVEDEDADSWTSSPPTPRNRPTWWTAKARAKRGRRHATTAPPSVFTVATYEARARDAYATYRFQYANRFKWAGAIAFGPISRLTFEEDAPSHRDPAS